MYLQNYPGTFISVEGIEGVGKSTAVKFIQNYLSRPNLIVTREPGGTKIAEEIRAVVLQPSDEKMTIETELLLMFASRSEHLAKVIVPALQQGNTVICDRFVDATYAYQGGGRQMALSHITMLEKWIVGLLKPTLTILLDADPEIGLMRAKHRGPHDRIESEKIEFFQRVRAVYLQRAAVEPERFYVIDAAQSLETVQLELQKAIDLRILQ